MIIVAVLCLGLAAGGYLIGGRMGGSEPAAASEPEPEPEPEVGEIVDLDAVNVNLVDGHYLRVAVSLGLNAHAPESESAEAESADHGAAGGAAGGATGATEDEGSDFPTAPAADLVLSTFAGRSIEQLADAAGREAARQDLLHGIHAYYGEDAVLTVFFTEFVMQ